MSFPSPRPFGAASTAQFLLVLAFLGGVEIFASDNNGHDMTLEKAADWSFIDETRPVRTQLLDVVDGPKIRLRLADGQIVERATGAFTKGGRDNAVRRFSRGRRYAPKRRITTRPFTP